MNELLDGIAEIWTLQKTSGLTAMAEENGAFSGEAPTDTDRVKKNN